MLAIWDGALLLFAAVYFHNPSQEQADVVQFLLHARITVAEAALDIARTEGCTIIEAMLSSVRLHANFVESY